MKSLQGTPWDRLICRTPSRKTAQDSSSQAPHVPALPMAKETERPSEDASERRSAKAQDLNLPTVPQVITVPRAAETERTEVIVVQTHGGRRWGRSRQRSQRQPDSGPIASSEQSDGTNRLDRRTTAREFRCQA